VTTLPIYQIDAFTDQVFGGNPAAVCPLDAWIPDAQMQAIAAENNLSETAFFVAEGDGYRLRWFTPTVEVDLCGHATLAAGWLVLNRLAFERGEVRFATRSGDLFVRRDGDLMVLDFPAAAATKCPAPEELIRGLGREPFETYRAEYYLALFDDAKTVAALDPDFSALRTLSPSAVIASAPGDDVDFVSRFFAPGFGIPEDPVTGSAHCILTPYWSNRLGRKSLTARQISARGGELYCEDLGDRVAIGGRAVLFMEGRMYL
jgi:predicted PhzF superfamily epimerase YddE/YHI9